MSCPKDLKFSDICKAVDPEYFDGMSKEEINRLDKTVDKIVDGFIQSGSRYWRPLYIR